MAVAAPPESELAKRRAQDWWCSVCEYRIFGKKDKCAKCGNTREREALSTRHLQPGMTSEQIQKAHTSYIYVLRREVRELRDAVFSLQQTVSNLARGQASVLPQSIAPSASDDGTCCKCPGHNTTFTGLMCDTCGLPAFVIEYV